MPKLGTTKTYWLILSLEVLDPGQECAAGRSSIAPGELFCVGRGGERRKKGTNDFLRERASARKNERGTHSERGTVSPKVGATQMFHLTQRRADNPHKMMRAPKLPRQYLG